MGFLFGSSRYQLLEKGIGIGIAALMGVLFVWVYMYLWL